MVDIIYEQELLRRFPALKKQFQNGNLWPLSHYVGTTGSVSAETIRKYIECTEHIQGRR